MSYTLFDLTALAGETVTGGTLSFDAGIGLEVAPTGGSGDLRLWNVVTSAADLTDTDYTSTEANALSGFGGTGSYGSTTVSIAQGSRLTQQISISLNMLAVNTINALLGGANFDFAFGQALTSSESSFSVWISNGNIGRPELSAVTLSLETTAVVPLPAAFPLFAGGLGLMGATRLAREANGCVGGFNTNQAERSFAAVKGGGVASFYYFLWHATVYNESNNTQLKKMAMNEIQVVIKYPLVASVEKRKTGEIATTHPNFRPSTLATD